MRIPICPAKKSRDGDDKHVQALSYAINFARWQHPAVGAERHLICLASLVRVNFTIIYSASVDESLGYVLIVSVTCTQLQQLAR